MFSAKLTRVAHRAHPAVVVSSTTTASTPTAHRGHQCISCRPSHQRRPSSSKASWPPDNSAGGGKPTPATKAVGGAEDAPTSKSPISDPRGGKRVSRSKRSRSIAVQTPQDHFAGLPSVPATQHIHPSDITLSSFFSLHRPLSLTTTIPPPSSTDFFDSIFETRHQNDAWENGNSAEGRPEDVIYTLHNTLENLESGTNGKQGESVRWEIIQESPSNQEGVKHLDSAPRMKNLDELVAQFRPFKAPPPPEPFLEEIKASEKKRATKDAKYSPSTIATGQQAQRQSQQKSYATTIVVTESTGADGQRTYTASSSPIVRIPNPKNQSSMEDGPSNQPSSRTPFRERMRQRQQGYLLRRPRQAAQRAASRAYERRVPMARRPKMILISVRRQRKLKMKKHKYKKLMKRTRNLRRRQDKL